MCQLIGNIEKKNWNFQIPTYKFNVYLNAPASSIKRQIDKIIIFIQTFIERINVENMFVPFSPSHMQPQKMNVLPKRSPNSRNIHIHLKSK